MTAIDPQAAVDEVRDWVSSARYDEELIELEAQTLRAVLEALDTARAATTADEDVRAVAALLKLGDVSFHGTWLTAWDDAKTTLSLRFADRIAELQERDVARFEADLARRDAHMSGETPADGTKP